MYLFIWVNTVGEHMYLLLHEVTGSISWIASNIFAILFYDETSQKLPNYTTNLVLTLVVITKESSSTPQNVKGLVHTVYWV